VRVLPHPLQRNPLSERVSSFSKSKGGKKGGTFLEVYLDSSQNTKGDALHLLFDFID